MKNSFLAFTTSMHLSTSSAVLGALTRMVANDSKVSSECTKFAFFSLFLSLLPFLLFFGAYAKYSSSFFSSVMPSGATISFFSSFFSFFSPCSSDFR